MNKAVQQPVQERDKAVHPTNEGGLSGVGWKERADGKRAVLVNERATVFDHKAQALEGHDPMAWLRDPVWSHDDGARWTPEIVHARLLITGEVVRRMPSPLRRSYVSILGNIALTEIDAGQQRKMAPTPTEISLADWTLIEIMRRAHRQVLLASAFGFSGDKIAETLKAKGMKIAGSTVAELYLSERRIMAGLWQSRRVPVDQLSFDRWEKAFGNRRK